MIGPLTLQVGKVVDKFNNMLGSTLGSKIAEELASGKRDIELDIPQVPVFTAAHAVYKGDTVHPSILWGSFWFLYYQAWLWKCSKGWRENVTEAWLRRLRDEGRLEQLLGELEGVITSYSKITNDSPAGQALQDSTKMTNDSVTRQALEDPANWMLWCPDCGEEFTLKKLLDTDPNCQLSETDLRLFVCPHDLVTRMVLKPTKTNIEDTAFYMKRRKEQNLEDALEGAYLTLKQHAEMAERENVYIDGFAEKRQIIDNVSRYCNLSEEEAEEIYFEAVRQMDREWREKHSE